MFRRLKLPREPKGRLYLHSMPGFQEPFERARDAMRDHALQRIVCLVNDAEIARLSPDYARAIQARRLPCDRISLPIPDMQVAADREAYLALARETARQLVEGDNVLVHCAYGIGRTGTFAACVAVALGYSPEEASALVKLAGSNPETPAQQGMIAWCAQRLRDDSG